MVVRPLSKELQEMAIQKLNENPKNLENDLKHIQDWAKTLPHLKIRTEDQWILSFLRACKFKLELVKKKLEALYTLKLQTPEWFTNRDPFLPEIQELLKLGVCLPLPNTAGPGAPRVILFRDCPETLKYPLEDRAKLAFMCLDVLFYEDDNYVIAGYHVLGDHKKVCFKHIYQAQPGVVKKGYKIISKGYITRPIGLHGINVPWVAKVAFNTMKYYAHEKLLNMVHIYEERNIDELYNAIPRYLLPKEYGGNGGSLEELTLKWKTKIESYREWFLEEDEYFTEKENTSKEIESDEEDDYYEDAQCFGEEERYSNPEYYKNRQNNENVQCTLSEIVSFEEFLGLGALIG